MAKRSFNIKLRIKLRINLRSSIPTSNQTFLGTIPTSSPTSTSNPTSTSSPILNCKPMTELETLTILNPSGDNTVCEWNEVECEGGEVTSLNFDTRTDEYCLVMEILCQLGSITTLKHLNLAHTDLTGQISTVLGSLTMLKTLE